MNRVDETAGRREGRMGEGGSHETTEGRREESERKNGGGRKEEGR
jgi:hypothetical protein